MPDDERPVWSRDTMRDRTVLVTGGASGIGRACVERFVAAGARVAAVDIAAPADGGATADGLAIVADVNTEDGAQHAVETVCREFGSVEVLVNNVGGMGPITARRFEELTAAEWDELVSFNLRPTFLVTRAVLHSAAREALRSIVNIGASLGERAAPHLSAYGAAKAAVSQLTRTLAVELGPEGVRVNCVAPGFTSTPAAAQHVTDERRRATANSVPLGRVAIPDEMADAVVFLASDFASFVSGQTLVVDGGLLCTTLRAPRGWRDLGGDR
jgi:NAD(P)-dependent dehydrogenase (short-subunit alcohol dehydrogenase family)